MDGTRLYHIWGGMKCRCSCPTNKDYPNYGGRGIGVCEEWKNDFSAFMKWAFENGYTDELTLDRIDTNGNYCPENCRWVTNLVQQNNKRTSHYIEHNGEKHTIAEWARMLGLRRDTLRQRVLAGWPLDKILSSNKRKYTRKNNF
jgi:hypothetical protein